MQLKTCYVIPPHTPEQVEKQGGYMPSLVIEGVPGHAPLNGGNHEFALPWVWGPTLEDAEEKCKVLNEQLGLTESVVMDLILKSFK